MGPRAPLGAALPARPRLTSLPPAISPPLPPFPLVGPARSRLAPSSSSSSRPPSPGFNVLSPARRTPWSPARVPGEHRPLRLSHRRPLPPALPPPPPPAGAAGKCSRLAGGGRPEGGGGGTALQPAGLQSSAPSVPRPQKTSPALRAHKTSTNNPGKDPHPMETLRSPEEAFTRSSPKELSLPSSCDAEVIPHSGSMKTQIFPF